ncbi:MAG: FAD-binding oxidoreductase [Crocinitomicaceae bacterium]|nr:FAD-binding oxidoreductase [Crocinitomicaceae bacterium]
MTEKKKILIVGAGVSGITVSVQLIQRGMDVTLIDNSVNHCSRIAAGMVNPLVFRRMTKSWRVDEFIPFLKDFYSSLEKDTETHFFYPVPIRRLFSTEDERRLWEKKQFRDDFSNYMEHITPEDLSYSRTKNPFGSGRLKNTFFINTEAFLSAGKHYVMTNGALNLTNFNYDQLVGTKYDDKVYDDIIFCEGYLGKENPWFGDLPLNQTKGEMLTIETESLPEDESVNRKCFILPIGNHQFKTGSTYEWNTNTTHTTPEARLEILEKVSYLHDGPVKVVSQSAGIRPTTKDRRPLIGTHPEHPNYHIFNGLGTKGYMLAPLLSLEFTNFLLDGKQLDAEVSITRFDPSI